IVRRIVGQEQLALRARGRVSGDGRVVLDRVERRVEQRIRLLRTERRTRETRLEVLFATDDDADKGGGEQQGPRPGRYARQLHATRSYAPRNWVRTPAAEAR